MIGRKKDASQEPEVLQADVLNPEGVADEATSEGGSGQTGPSPLEAALAETQEYKDRFVRLQAEWDNFRKRNVAEREAERNRAAERLVKELLPVIDDFERALSHAADAPDSATLIDGIEAVRVKLLAALAKEKVVPVDPKGDAFDAMKHHAVGKVEDASVADETVMEVYQKGYEMAGRVIRPAMVVISTGGPVREAPKDE